jgi:hypothetical protein
MYQQAPRDNIYAVTSTNSNADGAPDHFIREGIEDSATDRIWYYVYFAY